MRSSSFHPMLSLAVCFAVGACTTDVIGPDGVPAVSAKVATYGATSAAGSVALKDTTLSIGDTTSLVVTVRDRSGRDVTKFARFRYESRDTSVATVSAKGVVTIRGFGKTALVVRSTTKYVDSVSVGVTQVRLPSGNLSAGPDSAPPQLPYTPDPGIFTDTVSVSPTQATLPQRFVSHAFPSAARTVTLRQGGDLQAAIDSARRGDQIVLARGATFTGGFVLKRKAGAGWITIRSETEPALIGIRPTPAMFAAAAKLTTSTNGVPVIDAEAGASGYWISGVEISAASNVTTLGALVFLSPARGSAADVPSRIVIERSYVHGHDNLNMQRCVHFDATDAAVTDSWISDCHFRGLDSQAILVITSPGQLLFRNNFLSGAGENLMIGGGGPAVSGMLPEDIEIVGNHFFKPLSWQAAGWTVKNLLEIKIGRRIDIRDNYLENNWVMGQIGFAVVIKASDQTSATPWVRTSDIVFRRNIVTGSAAGVNIFEDGPVGTNRIAILANQFSNIGMNSLGGVGRMVQLIGKLTDIEIRQNTMMFGQAASASNSAIMMDGRGSERLNIVNNIFQGGDYGFILSGGGTGLAAVQGYALSSTVSGNAISLGFGGGYGSQNLIVPSVAAFGFANASVGDFRLVTTSAIRNSGARGATPGVPVGALAGAAAARIAF